MSRCSPALLNWRPMSGLASQLVRSGLEAAWFLEASPMRRSPPSVKATHEGVRDPVALVVGDDLHAPFPVDADARVCGAQVDADHGAAGTFFSGRCCIGRRGHEEKQPGSNTRNETRTNTPRRYICGCGATGESDGSGESEAVCDTRSDVPA